METVNVTFTLKDSIAVDLSIAENINASATITNIVTTNLESNSQIIDLVDDQWVYEVSGIENVLDENIDIQFDSPMLVPGYHYTRSGKFITFVADKFSGSISSTSYCKIWWK